MQTLELGKEGALRTAPGWAETDLVEAARAGNGAAFEAIMRRHNRLLFRTARAILKDEAEAEDAVQEAYIKAFSKLSTFAGKASLSTWLVRITVNEALSRRRGGSRRFEMDEFDELQDLGAEKGGSALGAADQRDTPESCAARGEIRRLIEQAIDELPQHFRTVFVLRAVEEFSVAETASCLDIPQDTVKTRFHRAKQALRQALDRRLDSVLAETFPFAGRRCDRIVAQVLARLGPAADTKRH